MPSSPLKRPSAGGRLRRLLASLRPPACAGPLPVQTGFPTSLADLVVKNHGRFHNSRRRHRATAAPPSPAAPDEPEPQQRRELSVAQQDAAAVARTPAVASGSKGAAFSIRPEVLAVGGAVALALLLIWSKLLVAAATVASVALLWIESRASPSRRPRPETIYQEPGALRGLASPIEEAAEPDKGSDQAADSDADDPSSVAPAKRKGERGRRRSLRKLLAKKLRSGKRHRDKDSRHGGAGEVNAGSGRVETEPAPEDQDSSDTAPPPPEAGADEGCQFRRGRELPLAALAPIVLVGLVGGKLAAVALTVLCVAFFSSSSVPDNAAPASGDLNLR